MAFALPGWWELTMTKLRRKSDGKKKSPSPPKNVFIQTLSTDPRYQEKCFPHLLDSARILTV